MDVHLIKQFYLYLYKGGYFIQMTRQVRQPNLKILLSVTKLWFHVLFNNHKISIKHCIIIAEKVL